MKLTPTQIQEAARLLAHRRLHGLQGEVLPDDCRPHTLDDAWAIQQAVGPCMGLDVVGWKCGTPGPDKRVVAPIYAGTVHRAAATPVPVWAHAASVRIEPELAFVFGRDLPARSGPFSHAEIDAAVSSMHMALELIDSRYADEQAPTFADKLADGLVNQGLFIGPPVAWQAACASPAFDILTRIDEAPPQRRPGCHPDRDVRAPLYWLVSYLHQQGLGLQAGQAVITGSYAGTFAVPLARRITVTYEGLGEMACSFMARERASTSGEAAR